MKRCIRLLYWGLAALWYMPFPLLAFAAPLDLPHTPLGASTNVEPNVMLLFDNSGSMENVIWDSGYNPTVIYPDWNPGGWRSYWNYVSDLSQGSCPNDYAVGERGGATKCLKLPAPLGTKTRYYTNYLNYLFQTYATNTDLTTGTIPNDARLTVAQTVTSLLVSNTSGVRFGMTIFNTGRNINMDEEGTSSTANRDHGGEVIAVCGSDPATLQSAIAATRAETNTPIAESFYEITRYFRGMKGYYNSAKTYTSPIQYRCQQNHVVVITDGLPTFDSTYPSDDPYDLSQSASLPNWDGLTPYTALPSNDADRTNPAHYPQYSDGYGGHESYEGAQLYLDDLAKFGYELDLRQGGTDNEGESFDAPDFPKQTLRTSTVGFAAPYQMLKDAAAYGGGRYYEANNANELVSALEAALENIVSITSTAASVAVNSGRIQTDSHLYQTRFVTGDWYGHVRALPINETDGTLQPPAWDAQTQLDAQDWDTGRTMLTYDDVAGSGIPFRWASLSPAMQTMLHENATGATDGQGAARLDYLRGDKTHEGTGNNYHPRMHRLGDVVHSGPFYVGAPLFPDSLGSGYSTFRGTYSNRTPMIYVGANDGFLHGFDANTGHERLAYAPHAVFATLNRLTASVYTHRYYVDGSPTVGDAYGTFASKRCGSGSVCWRSILVSGLRRGGQGVFALDVTDPTAFTEMNADKVVLWEFTDTDDEDLGYTYSQPSIVRMANGRWAAVFGNGYNPTEADGHVSATGHAVLYIVFLDGGLDGFWTPGTDFIKIDTGVGDTSTPNGLATPAPVDLDGDATADYIYAGDLEGNLWKFDVRDATPTQWQVAHQQPLFTATTSGGIPQPMTTRPEVGIHPLDPQGMLVYMGTGKYLELADNTLTIPTQTMYAIWDKNDGTAPSIARGDLVRQEVLTTVADARVTSDYAVDWSQHLGWYIDLPTTGERQASRPVLRNDRLIFSTIVPNAQVCGTGGSGWLMEVDAFTGRRLSFPPFDRNGDGQIDDNDLVTVNINGTDTDIAISGLASTEGMLATPAILTAGAVERKYSAGSSGNVFVTTEHPGRGGRGRQAWRTLP